MKVSMLVVQGRPRGKFLRFPEGEFLFGRGTECHIRPNSALVSRQHCLLRVNRSGLYVRDLGSTNGTLVNGTRLVGERVLHPGDQLQVGPLILQVVDEEKIRLDDSGEARLEDTGVQGSGETADLPTQC